jgi:hypothetical protein
MPSSRCVVQDCSNVARPGISIHASPSNRKDRIKWVNFVRTHRANFLPVKNFVVCSEHFAPESFHQLLPAFGSTRRLKKGSCPTIWKTVSKVSSARERRQVKMKMFYLFDYMTKCIFVSSSLVKALKEIHWENKSVESMLEITPNTVCIIIKSIENYTYGNISCSSRRPHS